MRLQREEPDAGDAASPSSSQTVSRAAVLHALHLGMSPEEDQDLLWIAVEVRTRHSLCRVACAAMVSL